jgi:hypothetical protein
MHNVLGPLETGHGKAQSLPRQYICVKVAQKQTQAQNSCTETQWYQSRINLKANTRVNRTYTHKI